MSLRTTYTINGSITFQRVLPSPEFDPWFNSHVEYTKDPVLGATSAADSYVDVGALVVDTLSMRASLSSLSARTALLALQGQEVTLSNTRGQSGKVLVVNAKAVDRGDPGTFYVDMVLEQR